MKLTAAFVAAALVASKIQALPIKADEGHLVLARSDLERDGSTALQAAKGDVDADLAARRELQHIVLIRDPGQKQDVIAQRGLGSSSNPVSWLDKLWKSPEAKLARKQQKVTTLEAEVASLKAQRELAEGNVSYTPVESATPKPGGSRSSTLRSLDKQINDRKAKIQKLSLAAKLLQRIDRTS